MTSLVLQAGQLEQGRKLRLPLESRCREIDVYPQHTNSTYVLEQQLDKYLSFLNSRYKDSDAAEVVVSTIRRNYQSMVMLKKPNSDEFVFAPMFKVLIDSSNEPGQQTTKYRVLYDNKITDYKQPDVSYLTFNQDRQY